MHPLVLPCEGMLFFWQFAMLFIDVAFEEGFESMVSEDCRSYPVLTYAGGSFRQREDLVVAEHELAIYLDGGHFISLLCTPRSLHELVVGFLHAEGIVASVADIVHLSIDGPGRQAHVRLRQGERSLDDAMLTVTTAGGRGGKTLQPGRPGRTKGLSRADLVLDPAQICRQIETFGGKSELFLRTGGAHSCALSDGHDLLLFEDDIGRHNALDKVIGHTLLKNVAVENKVVLTSGRVSSEIVAKVAHRGLGAIISRSAPTSRAIDLAQAVGMTLIGFVRGQSLNVYTHFCRLEGL